MFSAPQAHSLPLLALLLTLGALMGCAEVSDQGGTDGTLERSRGGSEAGEGSTPVVTTQQTSGLVSQMSPPDQISTAQSDQEPSKTPSTPPSTEPSSTAPEGTQAPQGDDPQGGQGAQFASSKAELKAKPQPKPKPKAKTKPERCQRGIHKGRPSCLIKRNHINVRHINRGVSRKDLKLIDEQRNITKEGRKEMLALLGDWREKKSCGYGYRFNYHYKGRASWRMYDCYVQDRLLWYLYLVGHHFDSEIQIVSGLRSKERKTSRHHNGHAVDFRVAGVDAKKVWEFCKKTFPLVGIGYYPTTHFVHLDVGRDSHQAYWVDKSGSGEDALYKSGVSQEQRGRARKSQAGMIKSIKRSLERHYKRFTTLRAAWIKRQEQKERAAKRRAAKKRAQKKAQRSRRKSRASKKKPKK